MARKTIPLPEQARLQRLLEYDPLTGVLFWKNRPSSEFTHGSKYTPERAANCWNGKNAGRRAFTAVDPQGYHYGSIDGVFYKAARVIWKIQTGEDPDTIDHLNGVRTDNRWVNLRNGSSLENQRNLSLGKNNTSGRIGVGRTRSGTWRAEIQIMRQRVNLGTFATFGEACSARLAAEKRYGFKTGHGKRRASAGCPARQALASIPSTEGSRS